MHKSLKSPPLSSPSAPCALTFTLQRQSETLLPKFPDPTLKIWSYVAAIAIWHARPCCRTARKAWKRSCLRGTNQEKTRRKHICARTTTSAGSKQIVCVVPSVGEMGVASESTRDDDDHHCLQFSSRSTESKICVCPSSHLPWSIHCLATSVHPSPNHVAAGLLRESYDSSIFSSSMPIFF